MNEQPYAKSSEGILEGVKFGCVTGITSDFTKVEIASILKDRGLCKTAFSQLSHWKVKIADITDRVKLNLLEVRNLMPDFKDIIHASTALTENVDALITRNTKDFMEVQRYFLVYIPERAIKEFNVDECLKKQAVMSSQSKSQTGRKTSNLYLK